jgi:glycosyltransferase involved in cell wall biosynthesis
MRFLFLTQYFPPEIGASQVRLGAFTRELVRLGHEVEVVTALPNYPHGRVFPGYRGRLFMRDRWEGIPVHRVWSYAALGGGVKRMLNYGSFTATVLLGVLRARRPDYIFVESPPLFLSVPAYIASRLTRAPFIFNVADLWPDSVREMGILKDGPLLRFAEWLEKWTYPRAGFVNAVTEGIRDVLIEKKGVPPERVLFLPNGVDTALFRPDEPDTQLAEELGLQGRRVILYAGTLGLAQGLDVALDALKMIRDELPEVLLLFIGSGSDRARLERLVESEKLPNVRFMDPRDLAFVARLYSVAFAGFASLKNLPLFDGARPSKIFPVMAAGKPVIYSGAGEGARLIEKANAGVVVPPEDPAALAEAIRALVWDPARAAELGRNGRRFAEQNLAWSALVGDWLRQLEQKRGRT